MEFKEKSCEDLDFQKASRFVSLVGVRFSSVRVCMSVSTCVLCVECSKEKFALSHLS